MSNVHEARLALGKRLRELRSTAGLGGYQLGVLVKALKLADALPDGLVPHRATYDVLVTARLFVRLATASDNQPLTLEVLRGQSTEARDDETPSLF